MARVRKPKSKPEETKEPLARSRVLSLSSKGFQEMVGIVAGRTTHGRNGLTTSAYCSNERQHLFLMEFLIFLQWIMNLELILSILRLELRYYLNF